MTTVADPIARTHATRYSRRLRVAIRSVGWCRSLRSIRGHAGCDDSRRNRRRSITRPTASTRTVPNWARGHSGSDTERRRPATTTRTSTHALTVPNVSSNGQSMRTESAAPRGPSSRIVLYGR
jgi:hypothetical protein